MCGIVGHIKTGKSYGISWKAEKILEQLMFVDTLRGDDATGAFTIEEDGSLEMYKEGFQAAYVLDTKEHKKVLNRAFQNGKFFVGHNRKATLGKLDDTTAHPFLIDDELILVHNGTLTAWKYLFNDALSDSHAIAHTIHKHINTDLKKSDLFWKFSGAWALVFYDRRTETFYLARNAQRPLHIAHTDEGIFFASEAKMLLWILDRNDVKVEKSYDLKTHTLLSMKLDSDEFEEEDITTSFTQAPHHTMGMGGKVLTADHHGSTTALNITKKLIKDARRIHLGEVIRVTFEDMVDAGDDTWLAYGESQDINSPHYIECVLSKEQFTALRLIPNPTVRGIVKTIGKTKDNRRLVFTIEAKDLIHVQHSLPYEQTQRIH